MKYSMKNTLIYTICTSDYDYLFPENTKKILPHCDIKFLCVDCKKVPYPYGVEVDRSVYPKFKTNYLISRYLKTNIFKLYPNYKHFVYLDGNVIIKKGFEGVLDKFLNSEKKILVKKHPIRNSLIDEFKFLLNNSKIKDKHKLRAIERQMSYLDINNQEALLTENNIFMFKKNSKVENYFEDWFFEIKKWGTRDQLCNSILLRRFNKEELAVWIPSKKNPTYQVNGHKNNKSIYRIYNWVHCRRHIIFYCVIEFIFRPIYYLFLKFSATK